MQEFIVSTTDDAGAPPHEFALSGTYVQGQAGPNGATEWRVELHANPFPPMAALDQLRDAIITDPVTRRTAYNPSAVIGFFRATMMPEDVFKFDDLVNDRTRLVKMEQLGTVLAWLSEQYVGGPTGAPSSSQSGGAPIGVGQTVGSPSGGLPAVSPI